jgi:peptide/nickel transport system substrate-binding protein
VSSETSLLPIAKEETMRERSLQFAAVRWILVLVGVALVSSGAFLARADGQARGNKLVFAARQDIDTLDPHITNRAATRKILIQFLDTLTVINPADGKVGPGLAESWDISKDGKAYTFKLRRNVKFHDGTPLDAAAVKFTFDRMQEPLGAPGVARSFLGPYDGADVVDPLTVRVRFKQAYAPFLRMAALSPLGPVSPAAVKKLGQDFSRTPVGTGPFMVKEWVPKSHVTLVRNPDYGWAPGLARHKGPAHVEEIVWRFVPEATTRTAILQTGEVNVAEDLSYADVAILEKNPDLRLVRGVPAGTPWMIYPNVTKFPTSDPAVRRALHHAIAKDAIVRVVFQGQSKPATSLLQPTTPGSTPLAAELFPHDPARAKKILDDAGWKPGPDGIRAREGKRLELVWIFGTNNGYEEMAPLIQAMAREVGIDIQLREQPRVQMYEGWRKNENNIGELNWWFPDPSILTTNFHTSRLAAFNPGRLSDPEIDKLLDQAAAMSDEGPRLELYRKIQRMLLEMGAGIPLVDQVTIVGVRKEVRDYAFNVVTFPVLYDVSLGR